MECSAGQKRGGNKEETRRLRRHRQPKQLRHETIKNFKQEHSIAFHQGDMTDSAGQIMGPVQEKRAGYDRILPKGVGGLRVEEE